MSTVEEDDFHYSEITGALLVYYSVSSMNSIFQDYLNTIRGAEGVRRHVQDRVLACLDR